MMPQPLLRASYAHTALSLSHPAHLRASSVRSTIPTEVAVRSTKVSIPASCPNFFYSHYLAGHKTKAVLSTYKKT